MVFPTGSAHGQEIGRTSFGAPDFDRFASRLRPEDGPPAGLGKAGGIRDERHVAGFELEAWLQDQAGTPYPINETYLAAWATPWWCRNCHALTSSWNGTP